MNGQYRKTDRSMHGFGAVTSWVVLALILLFAGLSVALIALGGQVYRSGLATAEKNAARRATISYVTGRVAAFDTRNAVRVEQRMIDGQSVDVLILTEEIDEEAYETRIYCVGGVLREQFASADTALESAEDGERIASLSGFEAENHGQLVTLRFKQINGETVTMHAVLRSGQEDAI